MAQRSRNRDSGLWDALGRLDNSHMEAASVHTRQSLAGELSALGVRRSDCLLLHSSMRSLGRVIGGPTAVILALLDAVGDDGTLVVPAQTTDNREPRARFNRRVPQRYWAYMRERLAPFDPAVTPSQGMGVIAERLRRWPGAVRSDHPQTSFAAVGRAARALMADHELESELGEQSPLAKLEAHGAKALLLGVGYDKCTSFHLAEYRLPNLGWYEQTCLRLTPAGREWSTYRAADLDAGDFLRLGICLERRAGSPVRIGRVGGAETRLLDIAEAVGFAVAWMRTHRPTSSGSQCRTPPA